MSKLSQAELDFMSTLARETSSDLFLSVDFLSAVMTASSSARRRAHRSVVLLYIGALR